VNNDPTPGESDQRPRGVHGIEDADTRPWDPADEPFMWDMLYESIHVRAGDVEPPRSVLDEPGIAHYLAGFGRPGDDGQIATDHSGELIGAAWCRLMPGDDPGYGFVADDVPELGMACVATWRGRGVGTRLLQELLERNPVMSLSVDNENTGAALLYERLGFAIVGTEGTATTMLRR
jgi:ribosomal protein S18 acetylase RimI-like enzyme